ncbi:MAG: VWA domain-containing protein [Terriglobales bacterium]
MQNRFTRPLLTLFLTATVYASNLVPGQTTQSPSEESSTPTYRSNVSEVRLVFFATDEHNQAIEGLQKDDFAVVDSEMVIRDFRSFARLGLTQLDVIVLMDSSESVLPHFEEEIGGVEQLISDSPWSPEDNLSVLAFSGIEAHFVCVGNCRSSFAADRIVFLPRGGATPLFDAIEIAANFLIQRRQPDVWPVIILFSDGDDTISKTSFREALEKIRASEAQVYTIDLNPPGQVSSGSATLQRIADESGGRWVPITEGAARIFNDVISDLHSARVVTYVRPQSNSDFHSVRIFPTRNLKLQFRCRRGYYSRSGGDRLEDGP